MPDEERGVEEGSGAAQVDAPSPVEEPAAVAPVEEPAAVAEPAPPAPTVPPEPVATLPPAAPAFDTAALKPHRKRTGLIVVVASIVLLLLACVVIGPLVYKALIGRATPGVTAVAPARAKIDTAIGFVKAAQNGDVLAFKGFLPEGVRSAITDEQWATLVTEETSSSYTFSPPAWSGDTTAVVTWSTTDTSGTLTFSMDPVNPLSVVMTVGIAGETVEADSIVVAAAGAEWRIVSISDGVTTTAFDAEYVKNMVATSTPDATAAP
jgi:hypothetical protein